jgi:hypothetical protein
MNTTEQHDRTTYNNDNEHPKNEKKKKIMQQEKMLIKIKKNEIHKGCFYVWVSPPNVSHLLPH